MASAAQVRAGGQAAVRARRENPSRLWRDRISTPDRIRWILGWLIVTTLAWGALATVTVSQHASGAGAVVTSGEPLAYDALQVWQSLSDANDEASAETGEMGDDGFGGAGETSLSETGGGDEG